MLDLTKINKKSVENKATISSVGSTIIISARPHIVSAISIQIRMNGGQDVNVIDDYFDNIIDNKDMLSSEYIIVDIEDYRDIAGIQQKIKYLFPVTSKKIFVGDVDSISFCDEMKRMGALYLHLDSQMMLLGTAIKKAGEIGSEISYTQKISVLGCKGGCGSTLMAFQLYKAIGELSHLPTLLVQGHTGTPDLDLISDVALQRDGVITHVNPYQAMKIATEEEQWQFDAPDFKNYNVVIFEHNVSTQVRDKLAYIVPESDFIFVVVTRELSAVRNARLIIDELERTAPAQDGNKTFSKNIIILNENHLSRPNDLSNEDIENYLGKKIDIYCSYIKDFAKNKTTSELEHFVAKMLGKKPGNEKSHDKNSKILNILRFNKKR
ncbi:hypothetical protein [Enterobacter sp.]|uniref:hypothetical protein n=1 Tax=Enterobacter sp. TaxID=42895 RepID=UPI00296F8F86|nr:hypothetical protein [Enterobacter sp.]